MEKIRPKKAVALAALTGVFAVGGWLAGDQEDASSKRQYVKAAAAYEDAKLGVDLGKYEANDPVVEQARQELQQKKETDEFPSAVAGTAAGLAIAAMMTVCSIHKPRNNQEPQDSHVTSTL